MRPFEALFIASEFRYYVLGAEIGSRLVSGFSFQMVNNVSFYVVRGMVVRFRLNEKVVGI